MRVAWPGRWSQAEGVASVGLRQGSAVLGQEAVGGGWSAEGGTWGGGIPGPLKALTPRARGSHRGVLSKKGN